MKQVLYIELLHKYLWLLHIHLNKREDFSRIYIREQNNELFCAPQALQISASTWNDYLASHFHMNWGRGEFLAKIWHFIKKNPNFWPKFPIFIKKKSNFCQKLAIFIKKYIRKAFGANIWKGFGFKFVLDQIIRKCNCVYLLVLRMRP